MTSEGRDWKREGSLPPSLFTNTHTHTWGGFSGRVSCGNHTSPLNSPDYLEIRPVTSNNVSSAVSKGTRVVTTSVASRRAIFKKRGEFCGSLGASRVGLPSCNDIMPGCPSGNVTHPSTRSVNVTLRHKSVSDNLESPSRRSPPNSSSLGILTS